MILRILVLIGAPLSVVAVALFSCGYASAQVGADDSATGVTWLG